LFVIDRYRSLILMYAISQPTEIFCREGLSQRGVSASKKLLT